MDGQAKLVKYTLGFNKGDQRPFCDIDTRPLTLEPHTACRKGGWGLAKIKLKINKKLIKN